MTDQAVQSPAGDERRPVWDLPTRLVHWLIVAMVFCAWLTTQLDNMALHKAAGYTLLGLLIFRLYWGFAGGSTARFSSFVRGPAHVAAYARGLFKPKAEPPIGHNPLGALSVLALLGLMAVQVVLGLFAVDVDGIESGPLSDRVSFDTGRALAQAHDFLFYVLLGLIVLHLAAIVFYLTAHRENLVGPMLRGWRRAVSREQLSPAPAWRIIPGITLSALVVWLIAKGLRF